MTETNTIKNSESDENISQAGKSLWEQIVSKSMQSVGLIPYHIDDIKEDSTNTLKFKIKDRWYSLALIDHG